MESSTAFSVALHISIMIITTLIFSITHFVSNVVTPATR